MAPTFMGGKLKLKGKKKKKKSKHSLDKKKTADGADAPFPDEALEALHNDKDEDRDSDNDNDNDDLTEAERKSLVLKKERASQDIEKTAMKSHRERVEEFNEKIGSLTELNDIPRVSSDLCCELHQFNRHAVFLPMNLCKLYIRFHLRYFMLPNYCLLFTIGVCCW